MKPLLAALALLAGSPGARAQEREISVGRPALAGAAVSLKTKDGWTLAATYLPATTGRTFLLAPMLGGTRHDWRPLARALRASGHGYLALDLRGHGDSLLDPQGSSTTWRQFQKEGQDNEFNQMGLDLEAAAVYLSSAGVAQSSMVVCGAALGANVALKWAVRSSSVPAVILLSPGINYHDVLSMAAMRSLGPRPVLIVSAESDRKGLLEAQLLYNVARQFSGPAYAAFETMQKGYGTKLLAPKLVNRILEWVQSPVKLEIPSVSSPTTAGVAPSTPASSVPVSSSAPPAAEDLPLLPLSR